jgi:Zn-dependent protease/CBS domain-containing protein
VTSRSSITLVHVRGIPIRAHWTLLLILPYLAIVLSVQFRDVARLAGLGSAPVMPPLVWGVLLALGLFASVALHELAHTFVALRFGGKVRGITLMLLGGVSQVTRMPRRPRNEALMALAGPATSLALGGVLLLLHGVSRHGPADLRMGLFYLGYTNVTLGVFNLLPAFPMDGGRILRALLATRLGAMRATEVAALVGRILAVVLGLFGLWAGNFLVLLIAVFVYSGAGAELLGARVRDALAGLRVADLVPLLRRPPPTIPVGARLPEVLPTMQEHGRLQLVAIDGTGAPVAVVEAADLSLVPRSEWPHLHVADIVARLRARFVKVAWDVSANDALESAAEAGVPYVVVTDAMGATAGLCAAADIETTVALRLVARPPSSLPRTHDVPTSTR